MEALHKRAVAAAVPITTDNASQLLLPVVALGFQIYALTYHGTKWIRLALWPVVVVLMFRSWFGFRFIRELGIYTRWPKLMVQNRTSKISTMPWVYLYVTPK